MVFQAWNVTQQSACPASTPSGLDPQHRINWVWWNSTNNPVLQSSVLRGGRRRIRRAGLSSATIESLRPAWTYILQAGQDDTCSEKPEALFSETNLMDVAAVRKRVQEPVVWDSVRRGSHCSSTPCSPDKPEAQGTALGHSQR